MLSLREFILCQVVNFTLCRIIIEFNFNLVCMEEGRSSSIREPTNTSKDPMRRQ